MPIERRNTKDGDAEFPLTPYQGIVWKLQWVGGCTRPDVSFPSSYLARQVQTPKEHLWQVALAVFSYLSSTSTVGLSFSFRRVGSF
jgi:hypothetical protein